MFIDLQGETFGRWLVLNKGERRGPRGEMYWRCQCACGTVREVQGTTLRNGSSPSCGCLSSESLSRQRLTHGASRTAEYQAWCNMKTRCDNPNASRYEAYGGRGISVCARWAGSFEAFYADLGPRPSSSHSIDRIDPDGNYEPTNCRWATASEQSNNKRGTLLLTLDGVTRPAAEWATVTGISYDTIKARVKTYGWSDSEALTTPVRGSRCLPSPQS